VQGWTSRRYSLSIESILLSESLLDAEKLFRAGDYRLCAALCRTLLTCKPADIALRHLLGVALARAGDGDDGAILLQQTLADAPDNLALRMDCALSLDGMGDGTGAVRVLAEGCQYHPGDAELAARLARLLSAQDRHEDARRVLEAGLAARPSQLDLRGLLIAELAADLSLGPALRHLRILEILVPGQSPIYANIGVLLQSQGDLDDAIHYYRRAIALDAGNHVAHVNLGTALMTEGQFGQGFVHYERRLHLPDMPPPPVALRSWRGEKLAGCTMLVTAEQGFGDMIQFVRFLPLLVAQGARIWLECPVELKRLLAALPFIEGVVSPGDTLPAAADWTIPLLSLPGLLGCGDDLRSDEIPYLKAGPGPLLPPDQRPRIGLVWSGRPAKGELFIRRSLARRSCRLDELEALWRRQEFRWFSLQLGDAAAQLAERRTPITDLAPLIGDFADSAALMAQLDLLISIDTASAHLAAALAVPTWVMLAPGQADYRWNGTRGGSLWYPKVRLFRAGTGGWPAVTEKIGAALNAIR